MRVRLLLHASGCVARGHNCSLLVFAETAILQCTATHFLRFCLRLQVVTYFAYVADVRKNYCIVSFLTNIELTKYLISTSC